MVTPTKKDAYTVLVFVGVVAVSMVVLAVAMHLVLRLLDLDFGAFIEQGIVVVTALTGGVVGADRYRKRAGG